MIDWTGWAVCFQYVQFPNGAEAAVLACCEVRRTLF
jgi:hypothetical protein